MMLTPFLRDCLGWRKSARRHDRLAKPCQRVRRLGLQFLHRREGLWRERSILALPAGSTALAALCAACVSLSCMGGPAHRRDIADPAFGPARFPAAEGKAGRVGGLAWKVIPFGELAPQGMPQSYSWSALGCDAEGRVYVVFGDDGTYDPDPPDCMLYSYDSRSGERSRLGSFARAALESGNLAANEGFMKGHTALVAAGGKVWMGTMPFHDAREPAPAGYRGSHLLAWDPSAGRLLDMSAVEPGGVVQERSGILALIPYPPEGGLVGLSVPRGDLLFFDGATGRLGRVVKGPAGEYEASLPRNPVASPDGRIFLSFARKNAPAALYVCDPGAVAFRKNGETTTMGFWNGSALTPDGKGAYISTARGRLYHLDFATESLEDLGPFLPADETARGESILELFCLAMDAGGSRIYAIPTSLSTREQALYEYDIAAARTRKVLDMRKTGLFGMTFTGSDARDPEGRLYFAVHYYGGAGFLLQIDPDAAAGEASGGAAAKRP